MTVTEIIRLAALSNKHGHELTTEQWGDFQRDLTNLVQADNTAGALVIFASKILAGKGYMIVSDNPQTIERCHSLAQQLGATVKEAEEASFSMAARFTRIVFQPPIKQ